MQAGYFENGEIDIKELSPIALAYIGDSVLDLLVRTRLVCRGRMPVAALNREATTIVSAKGQSDILEYLEVFLSEQEKEWVRRGRNAKKSSVAKNATLQEYSDSTGLETLFGVLHMHGDGGRIRELFEHIWQHHIDNGEKYC